MEAGGWVMGVIGLIGLIAGPIVSYRLGGKKKNDSSVASELTGTALDLVKAAKDDAKSAREEAAKARADAIAAQRDANSAWEAHRSLQRQFNDLKDELDHFHEIARQEASWAELARDALIAQHWPKGLAQTPPILTIIGEHH